MPPEDYPLSFQTRLNAVKGKRARLVVEHILQHGYITTADLERYGYKHPPRAVRDVRDQGIPIETYGIKDEDGKTIAAYRFGDFEQTNIGATGGRRVFPKSLKQTLIARDGLRCSVCGAAYEGRYLQIDHRIPYLVKADTDDLDPANFMLLCGSCNRAKSWSCELCPNGVESKSPHICLDCYWCSPTHYQHVATQAIRRLTLTWQNNEVAEFEELLSMAITSNQSVEKYVKALLKRRLKTESQSADSQLP
jgi:hypothetical protein